MIGISIDELRARHTRLVAERQREQLAYTKKDAGYMFVLGELELMIEDLEERERAAAASAAAAELLNSGSV